MTHRNSLARSATLVGAASLLALATVLPAIAVAASGTVWTTRGDCNEPNPQDENHYVAGDHVAVRGSGFDPGESGIWEIKGQPGGASLDPDLVVASGTVSADQGGAFCIDAYVIAQDDGGTYKFTALGKSDNYSVEAGPADPTPGATSAATQAPTATPDPTQTPTATPDPTQAPTPTPDPTQAPTPTPVPDPTSTPTPDGTPTPAPSLETTPTPTTSAPTAVPSQEVQAETSAPTLPPTDTLSGGGTSSDSIGLALMVLAGVLAGAMVLTPARAARRR